MNNEILKMARQAGLRKHIPFWSDSEVADALEAFAKLVAQHERERLAQEARECGGVLTVGAILSRGEA